MTRLSLFLLAFLLLQGRSPSLEAENGSEDIPSKWPRPGEHRPDWWVRCYEDNIIVVDGSIEFAGTKAGEIKTKLSDGEQTLFYIGHLVIKKLLFAAPGMKLSNQNLDAIMSGQVQKAKVLIRTYPNYPGDEPVVNYLVRGKANKGVFIFHYDSSVSDLPLVFVQNIPSEGSKYVLRLFAYRKRFGHPPPAIPDGYFR